MIVILSFVAIVVIYSGIIFMMSYRYAVRAAFPRPGRTRRSVLPGMQKVSVPVEKDYDLALLYWPGASKTLVLFSHNFGGSKETLLNHARIVHAMGYSTALFDYSNHGESRPLRKRNIFPRFADELVKIIEYLQSMENGPDRIILFAFSLTTVVALHIASLFPEIDKIICDSGPVYSYYDTFGRFCDRTWYQNKPFGGRLSFVVWCRYFFGGTHPKNIAASLKDKSILIIHNNRDTIIPRSSVLSFCEAVQDSEVKIEDFPQGPHLTALASDVDRYKFVLKRFLDDTSVPITYQEGLR